MTEPQYPELTDQILDLFSDDLDHRYIRDYRASVRDDTGVHPAASVDGEIVTTVEFLTELLAELRETRRLGNQLADALSVAIGAEVVNAQELADRHDAVVKAWRSHQKASQ